MHIGLVSRIFSTYKLLIKLWKSLRLASKIIDDFKPNAVVGVGGYASGPLVKKAVSKGIPALLQEQNSYAGVTNKLLAKAGSSGKTHVQVKISEYLK